jgi:hypothetical protein
LSAFRALAKCSARAVLYTPGGSLGVSMMSNKLPSRF